MGWYASIASRGYHSLLETERETLLRRGYRRIGDAEYSALVPFSHG